jgi:ubiquinone/menaquinone biosynthesis C-methylase UbiE
LHGNRHVRATPQQYDSYTSKAIQPWDDLLISRVLEERPSRPWGGRLLDIGAGTGVLLIKLCSVAELGDLELIATDYFEDMLDVARKRIVEAGVGGRIRVERKDAHALTYPDGHIRYVISRSTIHHWADPPKALREIHRVLTSDGVALIHDVRRDAPPEIIEMLNQRRQAAGIGPMLLEEKFTPDEIAQMCKEAGLGTNAQVHTRDEGPEALGFELRITR